jgi:Zn-dependent protease
LRHNAAHGREPGSLFERSASAINSMSNIHRFPDRGRTPQAGRPVTISPRFIPFAAAFAASGAALFFGVASGGAPVFLFVMSGWIVSLCLHEFGHAIVAYAGGDLGVKDRGYLSLDPLGYSQPMFSIVLPVLFLAMGGIGLPGGAVYIDRSKLRSRAWDSLVALAGPGMTLAFLLVIASPFMLGLHQRAPTPGAPDFWAGLAMLAYLQAMALAFNLLPLPGFDGFNALSFFMPVRIERKLMDYAQPVMLLVILAIVVVPGVLRPIYSAAMAITTALNVNFGALLDGLRLFRFWQ